MGIPNRIAYAMPVPRDLPDNIADWTPRPDRAVLLVHDMQRYFLRPFAAGTAPLVDLVRNVAALLDRCRQLGVPVAYTGQPGGMSDAQRGLLKDFWGPGMTAEPAHRQVEPALAPRLGDWFFVKSRYSAFHRTALLDRLRAEGRDQLLVCGVYAHVGVLMTACDAFSHDIQPFIAADAVADFGAEQHRMALDYAAGRCAVVTPARTLLDQLSAVRVPG
ncbi:isochorismatase family protein [Micromonosporaceae bacterium B7E4]